MGLMHAVGTAEVGRQHLDNPLALTLARDCMTETRVTPWYRNTIEIDGDGSRSSKRGSRGRSDPQPTDPRANVADALAIAMRYDADVFRAAAEVRTMLALPQEVMARPGLVDRIREIADAREAPIPPGPSREELLRMLA